MKRIKQWFEGTKGKVLMALSLGAAVMMGLVDAAVAGLLAAALTVKAIESQGVTISYTIGSPTNFAGIANVTSFKGPGGSASVIDVTNLLSTAKEKLMGLPDEGQFSLDINLDPDDASHQALRSARVSRTRTEFRLTLTDSTPATATFWGYVLGFEISGAVDQQVKASITIEIDGPVLWA